MTLKNSVVIINLCVSPRHTPRLVNQSLVILPQALSPTVPVYRAIDFYVVFFYES